MIDNDDLEKRLSQLRREYRGVRSMLEMMQKGTEGSVLRRMRDEKLGPLEKRIRELEEELRNGSHRNEVSA